MSSSQWNEMERVNYGSSNGGDGEMCSWAGPLSARVPKRELISIDGGLFKLLTLGGRPVDDGDANGVGGLRLLLSRLLDRGGAPAAAHPRLVVEGSLRRSLLSLRVAG